MTNKLGKSKDYAVYKSFEMVYLQLLRCYLKQKMEMGITKEEEENISKKMEELNKTFQVVKDWYKLIVK